MNEMQSSAKKDYKLALYSAAIFFFLMFSYFIIRPVRDEMGILAGVENMQWLFTGTFLATLLIIPAFGWLTKKCSKKYLLPVSYAIFVSNLLFFYFAYKSLDVQIVGISFFIWTSVYNMFAVSIFWSFAADVFDPNQAKKLYGPIAAGGSLGAVVGPALTTIFVSKIGIANLILVSAVVLVIPVVLVLYLSKDSKVKDLETDKSSLKDGSIWESVKLFFSSPQLRSIGYYIMIYTLVSTFLYFEQARIVSENITVSEERTAFFAFRDLLVNSLTIGIQLLLTRQVLNRLGVRFSLVLVPVVAAVAFIVLGFSQSLIVILIIQVVYRTLNHSIQKPGREVLYTVMSVKEKYKGKNLVDTAVYRAGDAVSGWLFTGLESLAFSLSVISFITIPVTMVWAFVGSRLGKKFKTENSKES